MPVEARETAWPPSRRELIQFALTASIALLAAAALIRGNVYYRDDLVRTVNFGSWNENGRPGATAIYRLITGAGIFDLAPFSQMAAIVFGSLAAHIVAWRLFRLRDAIVCTATSLAIAISPYFFAIYVYRFDSLVYSLGFLATIGAIYLCIGAPFPRSRLAAFALVLLSYSIYPPTAGAGLVVLAVLWCIRLIDRDDPSTGMLRSGIWLLGFHAVAMAAVKVYTTAIPISVYTDKHAGITFSQIPANVINHAIFIDTRIARNWDSSLVGYAFWLVILGALASATVWWAARILSTKPRATVDYAGPLTFPVVLFLAYGLGPMNVEAVLDRPIFDSRAITGFGPLVAGSLVILLRLSAGADFRHRLATYFLKGVAVAMSLWLVAFGEILGNTLSLQTEFGKTLAREIHGRFEDLQRATPSLRFAAIIGPTRMPSLESRIYVDFPILADIVPDYSNFSQYLPAQFFKRFGASIPTDPSCTARAAAGVPPNEPAQRYINFDIYVVEDCAVFAFKPVN